MAGQLRPFHPDRVSAVWSIRGGAALDLTIGLIDGPGAITEAKDAPARSRRSDRQSNTVINRSSKKGGTVTFTYVAEAELQDVLSALFLAEETSGTINVGDLVVRDLNGSTIMTYVGCFIEDDPTVQYGDTAADRAYVFGYSERVPFVGGAEAL